MDSTTTDQAEPPRRGVRFFCVSLCRVRLWLSSMSLEGYRDGAFETTQLRDSMRSRTGKHARNLEVLKRVGRAAAMQNLLRLR